ncbi:MAG: MBL fold metallo-hydrolase [Polyangiales bacterium]
MNTEAPEIVAPSVERLALRTPTYPPATHTNAYLVGRGRFWAVEPASPWEPEQRALDAAVRRRVANGETLAGAIVTHHHGDHVGGARAFCEAHGVPLVAHPETRRLLDGIAEVTLTLDEGDSLDGDVRVLHTPGHAPGHLCLWSPGEGWMIVGDMVASVGTILIDPDQEGDMNEYLAQLERLRALGPSRLLPAHGDPIDDAVARLGFYVAHRLAREARVRDAVGAGETSLEAIAAAAYADSPGAPRALAEKVARAHLARLESLGEVARGPGGWRRQ